MCPTSAAPRTAHSPGTKTLAKTAFPCHNSSKLPRNDTHGSPITGLPVRHGYYHLDVALDSKQCPNGADGFAHLVGRIHVTSKLKKVGALPGTPPAATDAFNGWLSFHYDTTRELTLENSPAVTTPSPTTTCRPNSDRVLCTLQTGSAEITDEPNTGNYSELRYDGADVARNGIYRFRIANEGPDIVTDYATLDVVSSRTAEPDYDGD